MSATADALQPQLVRELLNLRGRAPINHFSDVITNAPKAGYDLDFDTATSSISIDFREPSFLGAAVAGDANRFAAAAFSSFKSVANDLEGADTLSWGLVRAYYAAFYAGHAVLRIVGRTCTNIETAHLNRIRALADALGNPVPFAVSAGLYDCELNSAQTGFVMVQARGRVGGAHETFWGIFDDFLSKLTEELLLSRIAPGDAHAVFFKLTALRRITRKAAGASWLSAVRNEIQYRHARGAWAPPTINRTQRGVLSRLAEQWARDPLAVDIELRTGGDLGSFVSACALITALCRALLNRIADRSAVGSRSFARGPLNLC